MKHFTGDLFTSDAPALGHGVNVRGVMGAGIAKRFANRYPLNFVGYYEWCKTTAWGGDVYLNNEDNDKQIIVNMASQEQLGANATYEFLFRSAYSAANYLMKYDVNRCAIPEIGCGIGGLEWPKAQHLLEAVEILVPGFEWEVWHYEG